MKNVFIDPAYADVVKELKTRLAELRAKYKDSKELDIEYVIEYIEKYKQ